MQLGFYSLDVECAATKPEEGMEPVETEKDAEKKKTDETAKDTN